MNHKSKLKLEESHNKKKTTGNDVVPRTFCEIKVSHLKRVIDLIVLIIN